MTPPAIVAQAVSKRYRRFAHRNQLRTLKSALLTGSVLADLSPEETFTALEDVSFDVARGSTFAVIALSLGKPQAAILAAIVAGACFGFLRHNFYPARIFMGDSGALLLGFILATLSVQGLLKTAATVALFFPLLVLAIIEVESNFSQYAISVAGARGLMQVMPFWLKEIGRPGDSPLHPRTNSPSACTLLRLPLHQEPPKPAPPPIPKSG